MTSHDGRTREASDCPRATNTTTVSPTRAENLIVVESTLHPTSRRRRLDKRERSTSDKALECYAPNICKLRGVLRVILVIQLCPPSLVASVEQAITRVEWWNRYTADNLILKRDLGMLTVVVVTVPRVVNSQPLMNVRL